MFNKVTDRIYIRNCEDYTDRPNIGLIIGEKFTLLFDAGNSSKHVEQMKSELSEQGLPHPDFVFLSHWHWDHSFGAKEWNVPVISEKSTAEMLKTVSEWKWDDASMNNRLISGEDIAFCNEMIKREYPNRNDISVSVPDIVFDNNLLLDLGGITCNLILSKGPHSEDSTICYIPSEKFVFLGDCNCKDLYGKPWHFDIEHEEDLLNSLANIPYDKNLVDDLINLLDTLDFDNCISGHTGIMSKEDLYRSLN